MTSQHPDLQAQFSRTEVLTREERRIILSTEAELARSLDDAKSEGAGRENFQLEVLRRHAFYYRIVGGAPSAHEHARLKHAGFSPAKIDTVGGMIAESITAATQRRLSALLRYAGIVLAGAALTAIFFLSANYFESDLFAMIVTCLVFVTLAPLAIPSVRSGRRGA